MSDADIKAALVLAAEAKARADAATPGPWLDIDWLGGHNATQGFGCSAANILFVLHTRQDVPALADLVRRLADELLTVRAVLSDATSESAMYAQGVRDALAAVVRNQRVRGMIDTIPRVKADVLRSLLPP